MPESVLNEFYQYEELYPPVLARAEGIRSPRHRTIDSDYFTGVEGTYRKLQKILRPGYFAGSIPGSDRVRVLPRTYTTAVKASAGTSVSVVDASIFVTGGALSIIPPSVRISITSATTGWAAADTITITLGGIATVYTVVSGDIGGTLLESNTNIANKVLAAIKAAFPRTYNGAIVAGSSPLMEIVLWAIDGVGARAVAVADTGAAGTVAIVGGGSAFDNGGAAIGSITAVNPTTNVLTVGSSSLSLPIGAPVGVAASRPFTADGEKLGMISPNTAVDLLFRPSKNFALWTSCCVYRDRLPYWDGELASLFPEIELV